MNYDLVLNGKKEFYPNLNNKTYNILLVNNSRKIDFMINFFNNFVDNQNKFLNIRHYIGCDFEFNRVRKTDRDIALFQINLEKDNTSNLEKDNSDIGTIFVFYPPELNEKQNKVLLKLLTNKHIIKILHGGESLDIPYLFNQVLITEENIDNFCKNLLDTKYLCEYNHIESQVVPKKCSIYYLLEEYQIITSQKFKELESIEEKTGPIYLITIDIHKMSHDVFRYSLYDVLFLIELIKKFLNKSDVYTKTIPEIATLVFKYKRLPNNEFNKIKNLISSYNNYFTNHNNLLIDIYNYYNLTIIDKEFNNLVKINYFKEFFDICLKYLIYQYILKTETVYSSNKIKANILPVFNFKNYFHFNKLLLKISNELSIKYLN